MTKLKAGDTLKLRELADKIVAGDVKLIKEAPT